MIQSSLDIFLNTPKERIKNAYMLICPKEGELKQLALKFLQHLYCADPVPCGVCSKCQKVINKIHPDVLTLSTEESSIKTDDVRKVLPFIAEKAYEGPFKAVVIEQAELMTNEAQNCLLKPLEEPPANTVFLLLARSENALLTTIASRCEKVRIRPESVEEIEASLSDMDTPMDKAKLVAALSEGYQSEALRLLQDEEFFRLREKTLEVCLKLCKSKNMGIQKYADFFEEEKDRFKTILQIMLSFFFDLQLAKLTDEAGSIKNVDIEKEIMEYSFSFTRSGLSTIINLLCETEKRLKFALNFRLATESMLFKILEVKNG